MEEFRSLYCTVTGPGEKTYEWYHNGNLITPQYSLPGFYSTNSNTLTINRRYVERRHRGIYQLFVSSAFGRIFCRKIKVEFKGMTIHKSLIRQDFGGTTSYSHQHTQLNL
jgi:hypothetical protein